MDWIPLAQTIGGAAIALAVNELLHRHRISEAALEHRKALYVRYMQHLYRVDTAFHPDSRDDLSHADEARLIHELHDLLAEMDVVGSTEVRTAVEELHTVMVSLHDPTADHSQHQDSVREALRGEVAQRLREAVRRDVRSR